jgi:electron transport complex protein RnfD
MLDVVIALVPALVAAVIFFGPRVLLLVGLSVAAAVLAEFFSLKVMKRPVNMVLDFSAVVTGVLLAFNLPPSVPWWIPVAGSAFAIVVAKQAFGGIGHNIVNPALLGRAFLVASFPVLMTAGWLAPHGESDPGLYYGTHGIPAEEVMTLESPDAITGATPLRVLKDSFGSPEGEQIRQLLYSRDSYLNLLIGRIGGCLGETSALLLIVGALYLFLRGVLELRLPLSYLCSVALFGFVFGGAGWFDGNPLFHLLSGGVILGGFFMVTDMVTTPVSPTGRVIFGVGAGLITMVIRRWGGYPEGCSYSILLMNLATPLLDRYTKPKILGEVKGKTNG